MLDPEPVIQQFWAEPGSSASLYDDGRKHLHRVDHSWYGSGSAGIQASLCWSLRNWLMCPPTSTPFARSTMGRSRPFRSNCPRPSSALPGEGWQNDIYVTFQSTVGPNIADILAYIVEHFTDFDCDPTSFAHVRTKLEPFPANFAITDRKNVIQVLQEIAFQARCAIWFSEGKVYLRYLPEEPTPVDTITESDIDAESGVEVELSPTEDLVTKMVVKWNMRFETDGQAVRGHVAAQPEEVWHSRADLRLLHLQSAGHHLQDGHVLADAQVEHLETDQVHHAPAQAEP